MITPCQPTPPRLWQSQCKGLWMLCAALALVALGGCQSTSRTANRAFNALKPYQFDVVQGNFVSKEQVQLLQKGQSRRQVRDILGTPLVASVFHADRWDYAFTLRRQGTEPQQRKISVFFDGDALVRFDADELPTEAEFAASIDTRRITIKLPKLEASEAELAKFKPSASASTAPATAPTAPPAVNYPPLEPTRP